MTVLLGPPDPSMQFTRSEAHGLLTHETNEGRWRTGIIPCGRYGVRVSFSGGEAVYLPAVDVLPGKVTRLDDLRPQRGALRGTVVDAAGSTVSSAIVEMSPLVQSVYDPTQSPEPRTLADEQGEFLLPDLAPGGYLIRASLSGVGSSAHETVEVTGGEQSMRLVLQSEATIEGLVLRDGEPLGASEVQLKIPAPGAEPGWTYGWGVESTDAEGHFRFTSLPPGPYHVMSGSAGQWIELEAGEERRVTLRTGGTGSRVELYLDGRPCDAVGKALVCSIGEGAGHDPGTMWIAPEAEGGGIEWPDVYGRLLVYARWNRDPISSVAGWVEVRKGTTPSRIDLWSGELLFGSTDATDLPPPKVHLLAVDGIVKQGWGPLPIRLPRERTDTGWRYLGVPPGSLLRAFGEDAAGAHHEVEFRSPPTFPGHLIWP